MLCPHDFIYALMSSCNLATIGELLTLRTSGGHVGDTGASSQSCVCCFTACGPRAIAKLLGYGWKVIAVLLQIKHSLPVHATVLEVWSATHTNVPFACIPNQEQLALSCCRDISARVVLAASVHVLASPAALAAAFGGGDPAAPDAAAKCEKALIEVFRTFQRLQLLQFWISCSPDARHRSGDNCRGQSEHCVSHHILAGPTNECSVYCCCRNCRE